MLADRYGFREFRLGQESLEVVSNGPYLDRKVTKFYYGAGIRTLREKSLVVVSLEGADMKHVDLKIKVYSRNGTEWE